MQSLIRPAKLNDLAEIKGIAEAAYHPYVARIGKKPAPMVADFRAAISDQTIWVYAGNTVLGFIIMFPKEDRVHIENLAVTPNTQGQGIGRTLLEFAENHARDLKLAKLELYTNEKMTENLALYPQLGFREIERKQEDGFARVYFEKELPSAGRVVDGLPSD